MRSKFGRMLNYSANITVCSFNITEGVESIKNQFANALRRTNDS